MSPAAFIALRDTPEEETARLGAAFARGGFQAVRTIRFSGAPDASCWYDGGDWWLSTQEP